MYSRISNLVLGFHGCDRSVGIKVLHSNGTLHLEKNRNDYDWLGNGIYFWVISMPGKMSIPGKRENLAIEFPAIEFSDNKENQNEPSGGGKNG